MRRTLPKTLALLMTAGTCGCRPAMHGMTEADGRQVVDHAWFGSCASSLRYGMSVNEATRALGLEPGGSVFTSTVMEQLYGIPRTSGCIQLSFYTDATGERRLDKAYLWLDGERIAERWPQRRATPAPLMPRPLAP